MTTRGNRKYDKEFKQNAVNLYRQTSKSFHELSDELGVPSSTLLGWTKNPEFGNDSSMTRNKIPVNNIELVELKKRLRIAEEERDILKKALSIFSLKK